MPDGMMGSLEHEPSMQMKVAEQQDRIVKSLPSWMPQHLRGFFAANVMTRRPAEVQQFQEMRERQMARANAVAKAFRRNPWMTDFPTTSELVKSNPAIAKAELDVGTLTNFAQITGGQSLGYVSLDTQLARGTVRPNSFTLYQCLNKSRAFQVVDYWSIVEATGGPLPGAAFQSYSSVGQGTLATNAGDYNMNLVNLQLAVDGRAMTTALAAQNSFVDIATQETSNAALSILSSIDWASYWGNPTMFPNQIQGIANVIPTGNVLDFQTWNTANASAGWSPAQSLFNAIYQQAAQITSYNTFGRITHAFMAPTTAGTIAQLTTTILNNIITELTERQGGPSGIVVNGDFRGMRTRFGEIQFPIDLFITARDKPAQAIIVDSKGTNGVTAGITAPSSVTVLASGANNNSSWTAAYVASSGIFTYAVASCDASMNESALTYASAVSGIVALGAYVLTIGQPDTTMKAFRVYRSGLGFTTAKYAQNPAAYRYVGTVAASAGGSGNVTFTDLNMTIPGSEAIFLLDMDERDDAIDFRYLLPLTKIDLFAQNLYMPWAVACIGSIRLKIPKFHGIVKNFVPDSSIFQPLSANPNAV